MPKRRDLNLDKFHISKNRYRELYYFCLQYEERRKKIADLESLSIKAPDGMPHGTGISNPTEQAGFAAAQLRLENEAMEEAAAEADKGLAPWVLESAKNGLTYTNLRMMMDIPCGEKMFRRAKHKFFFSLDKRLQKL